MSVEEIRNTDNRYKQYPKFEKYYKDLKDKVEAEKLQVKMGDLAAKVRMIIFPTTRLNAKGYPTWHIHPTQSLLEVDVVNKLH